MDASVVDDVQASVKALRLQPRDAGMVKVAVELAAAVDELMTSDDAETRARMLPQISGQLVKVLEILERRAGRREGAPRRGELEKLRAARARSNVAR